MRLKRIGSFLTLIGIISLSASADDSKKAPIDNQFPTLIPQVRCPVMGGKIDSTYYTDIQGQRIYHCCNGCSAKLTADPETYFKKAADNGILFENIQTKCPVNGKPIDNSIYLDYQGRRIYFAGEKCTDKFLKEPAKYLGKLDQQMHEHNQKQHEEKHDSHQSHYMNHGGGCGM